MLKEMFGKKPRFNDGQRRRLATEGKPLGRKALERFCSLVTPNTLLAWQRRLVAQKYDSSRIGKAGRPRTKGEIEELIVKLARENRSWGYTRIRGRWPTSGMKWAGNDRECIESSRIGSGTDTASRHDPEGVPESPLAGVGSH